MNGERLTVKSEKWTVNGVWNSLNYQSRNPVLGIPDSPLRGCNGGVRLDPDSVYPMVICE